MFYKIYIHAGKTAFSKKEPQSLTISSRHCPKQWFSKCGPWMGSASITWESVRNALFQDTPVTCLFRNSGAGALPSISTCPSSDSVAHSALGTTALDKCSSFLWNLLTSRLPSPKLFSMLLPGCPSKLLINPASPFFKTLAQFRVALGQTIHGIRSSLPTGSWLALQLHLSPLALITALLPHLSAHVHTQAHTSTTCPPTKLQSF